MAVPTTFEGNNTIYQSEDPEVGNLPTRRVGNLTLSCWEVTPEEIAAMKAKIKALEEQGNKHAAEQVTFAVEKAKFEAESSARAKTILKEANDKRKADFAARLEALVKDKRMKPAQREAFMKEFDDNDVEGSVKRLDFAVTQIEPGVKSGVHIMNYFQRICENLEFVSKPINAYLLFQRWQSRATPVGRRQ